MNSPSAWKIALRGAVCAAVEMETGIFLAVDVKKKTWGDCLPEV
jgi:hypothetical protein